MSYLFLKSCAPSARLRAGRPRFRQIPWSANALVLFPTPMHSHLYPFATRCCFHLRSETCNSTSQRKTSLAKFIKTTSHSSKVDLDPALGTLFALVDANE